MENKKILVIDDEIAICELVHMMFSANGFQNVKWANDGATGLLIAKSWIPDIILLDLMLPEIDGINVCKMLKENTLTSNIPVIMLTAKTSEEDVVNGLNAGAIDYVTKPFSNKILLARVKAQLRTNTKVSKKNIIKYDSLEINTLECSVSLDGKNLNLTYSEYTILFLFAKHPGRVYTRSTLISYLKGDENYDVTDRTIDVQIVNLRKKLGGFGDNIETIRGIGYRFKGAV